MEKQICWCILKIYKKAPIIHCVVKAAFQSYILALLLNLCLFFFTSLYTYP